MSVIHQPRETNSALIKAAFFSFKKNGQHLKIMVNRPTRYRGKDYSFFVAKRCVHIDETFVIKLSDYLKANGYPKLNWSLERRLVNTRNDLYLDTPENDKRASSKPRIEKRISAIVASILLKPKDV